MTLFFRNADLGNTDSIAETDSARMFIYYFYSMGGNAIESVGKPCQWRKIRIMGAIVYFLEISVSLTSMISQIFPPAA